MITVLFACVQNAGRSQIAAALFNQHADPAKARAISAGTHPADRVHPEVVSAMRARQIDLSSQRPQQLTAQLESESGFTQKLLVENGINDAMVKANVAPPFHAAVRAMLRRNG